jgi:hypothetical protein
MKLAVRKKDNEVMNDIQENLNSLKGIVAQFGGEELDYLLLDVPSELAKKIKNGTRYICFDGKGFIVKDENLRPPEVKLGDGRLLLTKGWVNGNQLRANDEEVDDPNYPIELMRGKDWSDLSDSEKELFWQRMKIYL